MTLERLTETGLVGLDKEAKEAYAAMAQAELRWLHDLPSSCRCFVVTAGPDYEPDPFVEPITERELGEYYERRAIVLFSRPEALEQLNLEPLISSRAAFMDAIRNERVGAAAHAGVHSTALPEVLTSEGKVQIDQFAPGTTTPTGDVVVSQAVAYKSVVLTADEFAEFLETEEEKISGYVANSTNAGQKERTELQQLKLRDLEECIEQFDRLRLEYPGEIAARKITGRGIKFRVGKQLTTCAHVLFIHAEPDARIRPAKRQTNPKVSKYGEAIGEVYGHAIYHVPREL